MIKKEGKEEIAKQVTAETPKEVKKPDTREIPSTQRSEVMKRAPVKRGIIHIFASHNNTMLLLTDITGSETIAKCTGGMIIKAQHKEGSPYAAMKVAEVVAEKARERGFLEVDVKVRGRGGIGPKSPGQGAEAAIRSLTRNRLRIRNIENVTPIPHNGCRKKKRNRSKKG